MGDAQGSRGSRDYYWFAVLLIIVLATAAVHLSDRGSDTARQDAPIP